MENSLKNIFHNNKLVLDDVLKIGIKLLEIVENYHKKQFIHRDIKIENIKFDNLNNIFLINNGISSTYKNTYANIYNGKTSSNEYRNYLKSKGTNKFVGNLIFSSPYFQDGYDYYPKDDLISISYLLFFLYYRELPWTIFTFIKNEFEIIKALKKYTNIYEFYKKYYSNNIKIRKNPLLKFYSSVSKLSFDSRINYVKYKEYLKSFIKDNDSNNFSWYKK